MANDQNTATNFTMTENHLDLLAAMISALRNRVTTFERTIACGNTGNTGNTTGNTGCNGNVANTKKPREPKAR
jgi:hypothetical protein